MRRLRSEVSIQELEPENAELKARVERLEQMETEIAELKRHNDSLEQRLAALEQLSGLLKLSANARQ